MELPLGSSACLSTVCFHCIAPSRVDCLVISTITTQACAPLQNCGIKATRLLSWPQISQSYNEQVICYYYYYNTSTCTCNNWLIWGQQ